MDQGGEEIFIPPFNSGKNVIKEAESADKLTLFIQMNIHTERIVLFGETDCEASKQLLDIMTGLAETSIYCTFIYINSTKFGQELLHTMDIKQLPRIITHQIESETIVKLPQDDLVVALNELVDKVEEECKAKFEKTKPFMFKSIASSLLSAKLVIYMKGTFENPQCKFSRKMVGLLKPFAFEDVKTFNILEDESARQWLKYFSEWPTFPQIFVQGEFLGGLDLLEEILQNGEFKTEWLPKLV